MFALPLVLFAAIGLSEDLRGVSVLVRLAAQVGAACLASKAIAASVDAPVAAVVVAAVWLTAYVNAVNFMDGINGIPAVSAILAGGVYAVLGWCCTAGRRSSERARSSPPRPPRSCPGTSFGPRSSWVTSARTGWVASSGVLRRTRPCAGADRGGHSPAGHLPGRHGMDAGPPNRHRRAVAPRPPYAHLPTAHRPRLDASAGRTDRRGARGGREPDFRARHSRLHRGTV